MKVQDNQQLYNQMNNFQVTNCRLNSGQAISAMSHSQQTQQPQQDNRNIRPSSIQLNNQNQRQVHFDANLATTFCITQEPQQAEVKPFDQLEQVQINNFNDLINIKTDLSNKQNWNIQFSALQMIRSILKFHPEEVNNLYQFFGEIIVSIFQSNRTLMIKGCLALLSETFNLARTYKLSDEIIQKLQNNTLKALDEWIKYVLSCFVQNAFDYDASFSALLAIPSQWQKKIQAIQLIGYLLEKKKDSLTNLSEYTFISLMTYLHEQISVSTNKKIQSPYLQLCMSLIEKIGENAFLSIMQHSLKNEQIQYMTTQLQNYFNMQNSPKNK